MSEVRQTRMGVPSEEIEAHPGLATTAVDSVRAESLSAPADSWVGKVLSGVYRVEEKIGEGGMGSVYRATHITLGKAVAVKVLTEGLVSKRAEAVERLRQEAIAASSIDHDHIVDVISFDQTSERAVYIVMEFLRGENLARRIERAGEQGLSVGDTVHIALQVCDALGAAHARGIVHRDLKPENIFLALRGDRERVKVLDFGISKIKSADAEQVRVTRTGQLVGTPLYMSPEQARGVADLDHRADIYALGVMLFEMLTGSPPFEGRNYFELLWKHGNEAPPSPSTRVPGLPQELDAVVTRALAKEPAERFQSMAEVAVALAPFADARISTPRVSRSSDLAPPLTSTPVPSLGPAPPSPPSRRAPIGVGVGIAAGLAAAVWAWTRPGEGARTPAVEAPPVAAAATQAGPSVEVTPPIVHADPPAPGPRQVTVSFGSVPAGATVRVGDAVLCVTPCLYDLPESTDVEVSFVRAGYTTHTEILHVADEAGLVARLRPRREITSGGGIAIKGTL